MLYASASVSLLIELVSLPHPRMSKARASPCGHFPNIWLPNLRNGGTQVFRYSGNESVVGGNAFEFVCVFMIVLFESSRAHDWRLSWALDATNPYFEVPILIQQLAPV